MIYDDIPAINRALMDNNMPPISSRDKAKDRLARTGTHSVSAILPDRWENAFIHPVFDNPIERGTR